MKLPKILTNKDGNGHVYKALKERSIPSLIGNDAYVDWVVMIIVSIIVSIVFIYFGISTYYGVEEKINEQNQKFVPVSKEAVDTKALDRVLGEFENRANAEKNLDGGYNASHDPSL